LAEDQDTEWRAGEDETKSRQVGDCDAYQFAIDTDANRPKVLTEIFSLTWVGALEKTLA
jgi:hypothetical protein